MKYFLSIFLSMSVWIFAQDIGFSDKLVKAAQERTKLDITYDGRYFSITYPNGDIPKQYGVCTDLVIRSYRKMSIDLQKKVHEDMKQNFKLYPKLWGHTKTDKNIDHRRVPNLRVFFKRFGQSLVLTKKAKDYLPGDLVTWNLNQTGSTPHIGIVSNKKSPRGTPLIIHNIGAGPKEEDVLFDYKITGHYRYQK